MASGYTMLGSVEKKHPISLRNVQYGAERTRTSGLAFRKRLLYPLSYSPFKQILPQEVNTRSRRYDISQPGYSYQVFTSLTIFLAWYLFVKLYTQQMEKGGNCEQTHESYLPTIERLKKGREIIDQLQ